jgi:bisphosphoglycerate-dependent phosphoglycerate mutase
LHVVRKICRQPLNLNTFYEKNIFLPDTRRRTGGLLYAQTGWGLPMVIAAAHRKPASGRERIEQLRPTLQRAAEEARELGIATAQALAHAMGHSVRTHVGLRERHFGVFQGRTFAEVEAEWPEHAVQWRKRTPDWAPPGGGESLLRLHARIVDTVNELAAQHTGQQMVLVAQEHFHQLQVQILHTLLVAVVQDNLRPC